MEVRTATMNENDMRLCLYDHGLTRAQMNAYTSAGIPVRMIYESFAEMIAADVDLSTLNGSEETQNFFSGKKFLHNVMGDYLIKEFNICKINGALHVYQYGVYKRDESAIHGCMIQLLPGITTAQRKETYKYMENSPYTPVRQVSPPHLIPFKSKIYNLKTEDFEEYTPEKVFLNKFPYDYKPNAEPRERIAETIKAIACDDSEVINLLFEAFGNCFYMLNAYRGSVMLYGPNGSNGKSTLLNMLAQMVGRDNASFLSLQETAERFKLIGMYGKAVNIGDDIPETALLDSSVFKKLATGEEVTAEKKGEQPISFRSYAKMFFALNELPTIKDKSKAFFSRVLVVPLNADFSKTKDTTLKDTRWSDADMEFLVRLSVDGLKRLMRQGKFTTPRCVNEIMESYERENNPIVNFMSEYLENKELDGMPIEEAYNAFVLWCQMNGHKNIVTKTKFSRTVINVYSCATLPARHPYYAKQGKVSGRCFAFRSA